MIQPIQLCAECHGRGMIEFEDGSSDLCWTCVRTAHSELDGLGTLEHRVPKNLIDTDVPIATWAIPGTLRTRRTEDGRFMTATQIIGGIKVTLGVNRLTFDEFWCYPEPTLGLAAYLTYEPTSGVPPIDGWDRWHGPHGDVRRLDGDPAREYRRCPKCAKPMRQVRDGMAPCEGHDG